MRLVRDNRGSHAWVRGWGSAARGHSLDVQFALGNFNADQITHVLSACYSASIMFDLCSKVLSTCVYH